MNGKTRFSNRVENYIKYRPDYPAQAISFLCDNLGINKQSVIAETGSGTGEAEMSISERDPLYRECAHHVLMTGRQPADKVVQEIVALLGDERPSPDPHS